MGNPSARQGASGQVTLELALLLPIVLGLILGLIEVSLLLSDRARLQHAAREGARVAAVTSDIGVITAAIERVGFDEPEVHVSPSPGARVQGEPVTVSVVHRTQGRFPVIGFVVRGVRLDARAVMRIESP